MKISCQHLQLAIKTIKKHPDIYEWRKLAFTIVNWMKTLFSWLNEAEDESITVELKFLDILKNGFDGDPMKFFIDLAKYPLDGNELKNLTGLIRILSSKLINDDQALGELSFLPLF